MARWKRLSCRACGLPLKGEDHGSNHQTPPIHPGRILKRELEEAGVTANAVALALRIPANRLTAIINGQRSISADTAMRLGKYFGTSAQMWMNLQSRYELQVAEDALSDRIEKEVEPLQKTA